MSTPAVEYEDCYCDPSLTGIFLWTKGCNEGGCRAYAALFFIGFFLTTADCARRMFLLRHQKKSATFISLCFLLFGSGIHFLRFLLIVAKVSEIRSSGAFLFYGMGGTTGAYMWILIVWCDIIVQVNFSKYIQKYIPIVRYAIIFLTVGWLIGLTVGTAVYWYWMITNIWIMTLIFLEMIGFAVLGYIIWSEYRDVSSISAHGKLPEETYKKIKKIIQLSVFAVISSLFVVIFLWVGSIWFPKNNKENVVWLFVQRGTTLLWTVSILVCLSPPTNQGDQSGKSSSKWSSKMKDLAFSKGSDMEYVVEQTPEKDTEAQQPPPQNNTSNSNVEVGVTQGGSNS